jgi:hypothetical protein
MGLREETRVSGQQQRSFSILKIAQWTLLLQQPTNCLKTRGQTSNIVWKFVVPPGVTILQYAKVDNQKKDF